MDSESKMTGLKSVSLFLDRNSFPPPPPHFPEVIKKKASCFTSHLRLVSCFDTSRVLEHKGPESELLMQFKWHICP